MCAFSKIAKIAETRHIYLLLLLLLQTRQARLLCGNSDHFGNSVYSTKENLPLIEEGWREKQRQRSLR